MTRTCPDSRSRLPLRRAALGLLAIACAGCANTSTKDAVAAPVPATARVAAAVVPTVAAGALQTATLSARTAVGVAGAAAGALASTPPAVQPAAPAAEIEGPMR